MSGFLSPKEIAETVLANCRKKAAMPVGSMMVLGLLAGAYIAFGAELSTFVTHDTSKHLGLGISKLLAGGVFSVGLMLVVIGGGELFTGNCMMPMGLAGRRYSPAAMLRNWSVVYLANFAGALIVASIVFYGGLWKMGDYGVGAAALKTATAKCGLSFTEAFFRGIGCNWLVCLAVWLAAGAKDVTGKIFAIFFPVMAFVASGFEHSIANMYFIPMGLFLKSNIPVILGADLAGQAVVHTLENFTWGTFFLRNLLPVTLGNIVGGALFVGCAYHAAYLRTAPCGISQEPSGIELEKDLERS